MRRLLRPVGRVRSRRLGGWLWLPMALATVSLTACYGDTIRSNATSSSTKTNPIDLGKLGCPSGTVKAIITALTETIGKSGFSETSSTTHYHIVCVGQTSGRDVLLSITGRDTLNAPPPTAPPTFDPDSPYFPDPAGNFFLGPDDSGSLAQLEASLGPGGFTPVSGVGNAAASVVETLDGQRTITLYVQAGSNEFHISLQQNAPDSLIRDVERQVAVLILPQLATPAPTASPSAQPDTTANFIGGTYAASLLTTDEVTAALGRPALPLTANGGRFAYSPGIDVSNAYTNAKDGSERLDIQVLRAPDAAAARTFLTTFIQLPGVTPDPALAGLGDVAYFEGASGKLYVLSGREIVGITVQGQGVSPTDRVRAARAVAAIIAPRLRR